jgi:hypothetical protein
MPTDNERRLDRFSSYFNLYDIFGYFGPGFFLLFGIYIIVGNYYVRFPYHFYESLDKWFSIIAIIISSYILGHLISRLSKAFERIPIDLLNRKSFPELLLFTGKKKSRLKFLRKASQLVIERFFDNYYKMVSKTEGEIGSSYEEYFREKIDNEELRPMDLIWDASAIILNKDVSSYNKLYSFLSLSGFFRTLTLVFIILTGLCIRPIIIYKDIYTILLTTLFIVLVTLSYINYIKFDRMYNYHVIRSFSLLEIGSST